MKLWLLPIIGIILVSGCVNQGSDSNTEKILLICDDLTGNYKDACLIAVADDRVENYLNIIDEAADEMSGEEAYFVFGVNTTDMDSKMRVAFMLKIVSESEEIQEMFPEPREIAYVIVENGKVVEYSETIQVLESYQSRERQVTAAQGFIFALFQQIQSDAHDIEKAREQLTEFL